MILNTPPLKIFKFANQEEMDEFLSNICVLFRLIILKLMTPPHPSISTSDHLGALWLKSVKHIKNQKGQNDETDQEHQNIHKEIICTVCIILIPPPLVTYFQLSKGGGENWDATGNQKSIFFFF